MRFNYIERQAELRLLSMNSALRTLAMHGNPIAKQPGHRAQVGSTPTLIDSP